MDRYEIEEFLRERTEDYEEQYTFAEKYIAEHTENLKERFRYAEFMQKPVKKNQMVFWNGNQCSFNGIPKEIFGNIYQNFGKECSFIWVIKTDKDKPDEAPAEITWVKKNSPEYWEALAVSEFLIGDGNLPVPFIKRREQVYFNVFREQESLGIDAESLSQKELDKTDYLLGGAVPVSSADNRKRILFLVNWKEEREHRNLIKAMLNTADRETYNITVATPRMNSSVLEEEFEALPSDVHKFIYRGRMTVTEKDFVLLRILEKHPELYVEHEKIREYVDGQMDEEWRRIWGEKTFDCVVLAGKLNVQQYYMACALKCKKRIFVDMDFLLNLKGRAEKAWETTISVFDRIYTLPGTEAHQRYGGKNLIKAENLPVMFHEEEVKSPEIVEAAGKEYFICDKWRNENNRTSLKLIRWPGKAAYTAEDLDYMKNYLPILPAGKLFFERLAQCCEENEFPDEMIKEICNHYKK